MENEDEKKFFHRYQQESFQKKILPSQMLRKVFFSISHSAEDIMTTKKNHTICGFKSGIVNIFPLVMDRPKWNQEMENNLIYFQLSDLKLTADWRFGKV